MKFTIKTLLLIWFIIFIVVKCTSVVSNKNEDVTDISNLFNDEVITCNPSPTFDSAKVFKTDSTGLWVIKVNLSETYLNNSPMNLDIQKAVSSVSITVYNSKKDTFPIVDLCSYDFSTQLSVDVYTASKGTILFSNSNLDTTGNFVSCSINVTLKNIYLQSSDRKAITISEMQFKKASIIRLKPDSIRIKTGWPVILSNSSIYKGWYSSPNFCDINNDGFEEILASSDEGSLYVWKYDGTVLPGWPYKTGSYLISTPAVGDVDGDGNLEIGIVSNDGNLYVLAKNGTVLKGWPVAVETPNMPGAQGARGYIAPVITDIDGDNRAEIIYASEKAILWVFKGDGTVVAGWPKSFSFFDVIRSTPCVVDLNGDGAKEIAISRDGDSCNGKCYSCDIYLWHNDGTLVSGWPRRLPDSSVSLGHKIIAVPLPGESKIALFVGTGWQIYAYNYDGSYLPGWPMKSYNNGANDMVAADLDNDGQMEIIASSIFTYVFNINGTERFRVYRVGPLGFDVYTGISVFDVDNDGKKELICTSPSDSCIVLYRNDGTLSEFGLIVSSDYIHGTPIVGDFDKDGITEIALGSYGNTGRFTVWSLNLLAGSNKGAWQRCYCTIGNTGQLQ